MSQDRFFFDCEGNMKKHTIKCPLPLIASFSVKGEQITEVSLSLNSLNNFQWEIDSLNNKLIDQIALWLEDYCAKKPSKSSLNIDLSGIPSFTKQILHELKQIPFGHHLTYKDLAIKASNEKASRAVGNACGRNPCPLIIPCHRVLAAGGKLGGFSSGLEIKRLLLDHENNEYSKT